MDPNEALKNARMWLSRLRASQETQELDGANEAAEHLADAFEALDGWLSKGGFAPEAWRATEQAPCFTLRIKLGNDAMRTPQHVAPLLSAVANRLKRNDSDESRDGCKLYDDNGNAVGRWDYINEG